MFISRFIIRWVNVLKSTEFIIESELKNFWYLSGNVRYDFKAMDDLTPGEDRLL